MLLEQTYAKLVEMKLYGMASAIKERLERPDHQLEQRGVRRVPRR